MYVRMSNKGIAFLAILLAAVSAATVPAGANPGEAFLERIALTPGGGALRLGPVQPARAGAPGAAGEASGAASRVPLVGSWTADGAVALPGRGGGLDYVLSHAAYRADEASDLLLHFDGGAPRDEAGNYEAEAGPGFSVEGPKSLLGGGSASFRGKGSAVSLRPRSGALFGKDSRFRDFSVEFWLYPVNAENGEVILLWQSLRKLPGGVLPQRLSCVVAAGRVSWGFENFFERPVAGKAGPAEAATRLDLRARSPLVPRAWSHHLLRFDGDTGLLEYLVDGRPEATAYATPSGREAGPGGAVFAPAAGAASPLVVGEGYAGLMDELRISRRFVEKPSLSPYGRDPGLVLSPVVDLGFGHSRLASIEAVARTPGNSSVELSYRLAEDWAGWRLDYPAWTPFRPGEALPAGARGRYLQVRADLYADGTGRLGPALSSIAVAYEPDPPPPPPARLAGLPKDGAAELRWSRVPESDVAGYLVYYGDAPGEYFGTGAAEGPSPVDAGLATTLTLTGLANGRLVYVAVAAYDSAARAGAGPGTAGAAASASAAASRAGEFSTEVSVRPSRTAR